ncbi:MAG: hypothetical protein IIA11_01340 [Proteobacteria bacterium]|nr:hypothetical protein [Pseudomonadota bacterium]
MSELFRLETERLLLRRLTLADADLMLAVWNDPGFMHYVGDRGHSLGLSRACKSMEN